MKKLLAIFLALITMATMSVSVFAAPDDFIISPSKNMAPGFVDFDPKDEDCTSALVITGFADKNTLPQNMQDVMNNAYQSIVEGDLSKLLTELESYVNQNNIDGKNLAVSDLFNMHTTGCENHENHKEFDITLDADTLKNFVGLMYMDENGKWHWVADAKVVNNGKHLKFTGMGSGSYAIVVDTTKDTSAGTGDSSIIAICATVMAVSAMALVVVLVKGKKKEA